MGIPNATHQVASNAIAAQGNWISLHTDTAGTSGANEASGSGYARQQSTPWAADGVGDNNGPQVNISCAAGTYKEGGIWSVQTGSSLSAPSGLAASATSGGSLTSGTTYYYKITGFNWSGQTTASLEVSATPSGSNLSVALTWSSLTGVSGLSGIGGLLAGFKVYRGTASGSENVVVATVLNTATGYTDTGGAGTAASLPGSNTASTFVGSAAFIGGNVTVTGVGASINVTPAITA
jgi:hypothetical protein